MSSAVASSTIIVLDHCTFFHPASFAKGKMLIAKSVITLDDEVRTVTPNDHSIHHPLTGSADTVDMGTCQVPSTAEGYTLTVNCISQKSSWSLGKILFMFVSTESRVLFPATDRHAESIFRFGLCGVRTLVHVMDGAV